MSRPSQHRLLSFSSFLLDLHTCELRKNGIRLHIAQQPARILALLASRAGELVLREELCKEIWGEETFVDFEHGLNNCIKEIRAILGDNRLRPRYIETIPRRGYRFIAALEQAPPQAENTEIPLETQVQVTERRRHVPTLAATAAAIAVLGLCGLVAYRFWPHPTPRPTSRITLAVLPFENLTGNPSEEYVSDGFTEEMITQLGRLNREQLGIIARTSSALYKGSGKPVKEIARELGVNFVLEGSIRSTSQGLRISAQVIRADDQTHVFAEEYDRPMGDLVKLEGEVAQAVAQEIRVQLTPQAQSNLASARNVDPEAYRSYLQGRYLWNRRSGESMSKAVVAFEQAIQRDSRYAPAYAGLADTYNALIFYGYAPGREGIPKAKAAAEKAVELGDSLAEAHASLGYVHFMWEHDWEKAEREFRRAVELNGNYSSAHHWYAMYLAARGRQEESLAQIEEAHQLDPFSLIVTTASGYLAYFAGRHDEAQRRCEDALRHDPNFMVAHAVLGLAKEQKQDFGAAAAEFERALQLSGRRPAAYLDYLGHAYASGGKRKEAEIILAEMDRLVSTGEAGPSYRAATLLALGERERAVEALEQGFQNSDGGMIWLKVDPRFDGVRGNSRYVALLGEMGLGR